MLVDDVLLERMSRLKQVVGEKWRKVENLRGRTLRGGCDEALPKAAVFVRSAWDVRHRSAFVPCRGVLIMKGHRA